jgi:hypothetical protein
MKPPAREDEVQVAINQAFTLVQFVTDIRRRDT